VGAIGRHSSCPTFFVTAIKQLENLMRLRCKLISLNPVSAAPSSISSAPAAIIDTSGTGGASAANWPAQREGPVNPWATFLLVAIGTFMTMLDASIVNISLRQHILLLSSRTSFEMMQKALAAGIPIVAAEFAQDSSQTLVGFLRGERMNIYAGADRVRRRTSS